MSVCESAAICGILDKHPNEKKELLELSKLKAKAECELKTLSNELAVKKKTATEVKKSFEMKIHDILIKSNPGKYLTAMRRPKEGVILADTYVLKKYYGSSNPSKAELEKDSDIFKTVIDSYEEKLKKSPPKNCVQMQLAMQGVQMPTGGIQLPMYPFSPPMWFPSQQGLFAPMPGSFPPPCASPPPPPDDQNPPLPGNDAPGCDKP